MESSELIPMEIAKAMKLIIGKMDARPGLQQVLVEASPPGDGYETARFVGTNGHVMLIVDTSLDAPPAGEDYYISGEPGESGKFDTSDLDLFISSKGHRKPECYRVKDRTLTDFPEYKKVMPSSTTEVAEIGFDVTYMDMMLKIHRALKLGKNPSWAVKFDGALGPSVWSLNAASDNEIIRKVQFVIMPMRLN